MTMTDSKLFGGLDEKEVLSRLRALEHGESTESRDEREHPRVAAEIFGSAVWSGIAEPGDRVAGLLVASLGASRALDVLVRRMAVPEIVGLLRDAGGENDDGNVAGESQPEEDLAQSITLGLERWIPRVNAHEALAHLERAARFQVTLLTPQHDLWPQGLRDLEAHGPQALWVRGNPELLGTLPVSIALVGARASTGYGEHVTMEASAGLVDRGVTVVSGAAYGIDGMAHRAALASEGVTIAFLAGGVDRFYPSGHDALLNRIVASGVVVSELPCGSSPTKWRFLQRNRLIAAASAATVVIEAGWRSGSLNTAGHASALGRPLGVVPGPVTSASSAGCHRLLRETDAIVVTNAAEMVELISGQRSSWEEEAQRDSPEMVRILDSLSLRTGRAPEEIARRSGLSVAQTQSMLGLCALSGQARESAGAWRKNGTSLRNE